MNGTPKKHSFSSSERKERKTEERGERGRERERGGEDKSKMEGKDRMGGGRRHEYIISLHSSTVTRCSVRRRSGDELTFTAPLLPNAGKKGHSDHGPDHLIIYIYIYIYIKSEDCSTCARRLGNGVCAENPSITSRFFFFFFKPLSSPRGGNVTASAARL